MSIRVEDIKERVFSIAREFRGQKMGMIGLCIIIFMLILAITAPLLAPDVDRNWEGYTAWQDNPSGAQPSWVDFLLPGSRAPHEIMEEPHETVVTGDGMYLTYNYRNDYDYPPSDITFRIGGISNRDRVLLWINLTRPDGTVINFIQGERLSVSERFQFSHRGDEEFAFDLGEFAKEGYMQEGLASDMLRRAFREYGIVLNPTATVSAKPGGWDIVDGIYHYDVLDTEEGLYLEIHPEITESFQLDPNLEQYLDLPYIDANISDAFRAENARLSQYANLTSVANGWVIRDGIFTYNINTQLLVSIETSIGHIFDFNLQEEVYDLYFGEVGSLVRTAFNEHDFTLTEHANISTEHDGWLLDDTVYEFMIKENIDIAYRVDVEPKIKDGVIFQLDEEVRQYLPDPEDDDRIHANVTAAFLERGITLATSPRANITIVDDGWVISSGPYVYHIDNNLDVTVETKSFTMKNVTIRQIIESVTYNETVPIHSNITTAFRNNGSIDLTPGVILEEVEEGYRIVDGKYIYIFDTDMHVETMITDYFTFPLNREAGIYHTFDVNLYDIPAGAIIHRVDDGWDIEAGAIVFTIRETDDDENYAVSVGFRDEIRFYLDYEQLLRPGTVLEVVRYLFEDNDIHLSGDALINVRDPLLDEGFWQIIDGNLRYFIQDVDGETAQVSLLIADDYVDFGTAGQFFPIKSALLGLFSDNEIPLSPNRGIRQHEGNVWRVTADEADDEGYMIRLTNRGLNILLLDDFYFSFGLRSQIGRNHVYMFGLDYHTDEDVPLMGQVNTDMIPFAKANEKILTNPESLKGDYTFNVFVTDVQEIDEGTTRAIFRGRRYGLMGTDASRRDIALGWVWGARWSLILGAIISLSTISIALLYGMTSAYYGGWVDEFMQRLNEILLGIPIFPILILSMFIYGSSIWIFVIVYTVLGWRGLAKIIRARGIQIRQDTYVEAAQSLGSSGRRVITRHMIPQLLPYAIAEGALMIPGIIITEAGMRVLGLGDPNIVTWGTMLSQAHGGGATITGMWWWVIFPGLGIILIGFAFISAGIAMERVINPKMRQR